MRARRYSFSAAALALLLTSAVAQEDARLPRPRPAVEPPQAVTDWAAEAKAHFEMAREVQRVADAAAAIEALAPLPRPRPAPGTLMAMLPTESGVAPPAPPPLAPPVDTESEADYAACLTSLVELSVTFEPTTIDADDGCHVAHPLQVNGLGGGVAVKPSAILDCRMTKALAEWMREAVAPTATRLLGEAPDALVHASAYICRNRYNDPKAKVSEHASANAVDVAGFRFEKRGDLGIGDNEDDATEMAFETAIRAASCRYFTTVLGPGSNAAHATHFHFDLAERRGGYRLCELDDTRIARAPEANTKRE